MAGVGGFRGVSADQDVRYTNKNKKAMAQLKFPKELDVKVDVKALRKKGKEAGWAVIKEWVAKRVTQLLGGLEEEVLISFIFNLLETDEAVNPREVHVQLVPFLEKNTSLFMKELWSMLASAQANESGVPQQIIDEKAAQAERNRVAQETKQAQMDAQRAAAAAALPPPPPLPLPPPPSRGGDREAPAKSHGDQERTDDAPKPGAVKTQPGDRVDKTDNGDAGRSPAKARKASRSRSRSSSRSSRGRSSSRSRSRSSSRSRSRSKSSRSRSRSRSRIRSRDRRRRSRSRSRDRHSRSRSRGRRYDDRDRRRSRSRSRDRRPYYNQSYRGPPPRYGGRPFYNSYDRRPPPRPPYRPVDRDRDRDRGGYVPHDRDGYRGRSRSPPGRGRSPVRDRSRDRGGASPARDRSRGRSGSRDRNGPGTARDRNGVAARDRSRDRGGSPGRSESPARRASPARGGSPVRRGGGDVRDGQRRVREESEERGEPRTAAAVVKNTKAAVDSDEEEEKDKREKKHKKDKKKKHKKHSKKEKKAKRKRSNSSDSEGDEDARPASKRKSAVGSGSDSDRSGSDMASDDEDLTKLKQAALQSVKSRGLSDES